MADAIRIKTGSSSDARELIEVFARRGLTGQLVFVSDHCEVEVSSTHEETRRLFLDVSLALEAWLEDRHLPSLTVQVGGRTYVIKPHRHTVSAATDQSDHNEDPAGSRRSTSRRSSSHSRGTGITTVAFERSLRQNANR